MGDLNPLKNDASENRKQNLMKLSEILKSHIERWTQRPRAPKVTKQMFLDYLEAVADLSEEQLAYGCREASKTAEFFPWPGTIRKFALEYEAELRGPGLGLPQELFPDITQEERDRALADSTDLKQRLLQKDPQPNREIITEIPYTEADHLRKAAYLEWLKEQIAYDAMRESSGRPPIARSDEERQAMFYALSIEERNFYRRKVEWTRQRTTNTSR